MEKDFSCMVSITQKSGEGKVSFIKKTAIFYGVFQRSRVLEASTIIGGHPGGVVAYPVAVVDYGEGLREVSVTAISDIQQGGNLNANSKRNQLQRENDY